MEVCHGMCPSMPLIAALLTPGFHYLNHWQRSRAVLEPRSNSGFVTVQYSRLPRNPYLS